MKIRILSVALICALAPLQAIRAQAPKEASTELEDKMDEVNGAWRRIGRQVNDASKNADSLKQIGIIRENTTAAMKLEPKKKKEVPAAQQKKFMDDYVAGLKSFLVDVAKVETALKAGKNAEAATAYAKLKEDQDEAHKLFRKEKEKKGEKKK